MKTHIKQAGLLVGTFLAAMGFSYAAVVFGWTGPSLTAPQGNVAAPLNVSATTQTKLGSLILNAASPIQNAIGLAVFGTSTFNGTVQVIDGTQGTGKVLTSDASGNASWQSPVSGGGVPTAIVKFTSSGSWTAPAGVTKARVRVWGAGGGGGNAGGSSGNGGGGGAGGYSESILTVSPGTSYTITIGAGGAGEAGTGTSGTAGTASNFGSGLVVAGGGGAGLKDSAGATGGVGGTASTGQFTINGQPGETDDSSNDRGGSGGSSPQGGMGGQGARNVIYAGTVPGGGGSGSGNGITGTAGAGADGEIMIEY